ncbi:MAG: alpha/beta hydrolase fold domain-containing protein [Chloroflexi bacterium]|nr:alpha/beta hydrolase fold domain-containing protein [Chloroflexota bacterium]
MSAFRWISLAAAVLLTVGCQATSGTGSAVQIEVDSRLTLTGTLAAPEGPGPFPAVVLMHGCNGLDPEVLRALKDHSRHLVQAGFVALVLDSFGPRRVRPPVCAGKHAVSASDYRVDDAFRALQFLRAQPNVDDTRIFLMGQSQGGHIALHVAARGDPVSQSLKDAHGGGFRALVAYYPPCAVPRDIDTPLLILSGAKDNWTPPAECQRAKARVRGAPYEVIVYPGEVHSFDLLMGLERFLGFPVGGNPGGHPESRNAMIQWFLTHSQSSSAPDVNLPARPPACWLLPAQDDETLRTVLSHLEFWRYATADDVQACIDERGEAFLNTTRYVAHGLDLETSTPIMWATALGNEAAVRVLLDAGSDLSARSNRGHTPVEVAEFFSRPAIADLIRLHP